PGREARPDPQGDGRRHHTHRAGPAEISGIVRTGGQGRLAGRPLTHPANAAARPRPALWSRPPKIAKRALHWADAAIAPYLYIAPFFLLFIGFGLFPILYTGYVSLTDRDLLRPGAETYIGLANFREMVGDDYFWNSVKNTFVLMAMCSVPQLVLALIMAHLLNSVRRLRTLFRMGVLLPNVTSIVAVALVFGQIYSRDFGVVN